MPRRQVTPSSRQSRRIKQRRMRSGNKTGSPNSCPAPNGAETIENEDSEDSPPAAVARRTDPSYQNPFAALDDSPPSLGRRKLKTSDATNILQQKKARIDLTADSDSPSAQDSEEEITFNSPSASDSSSASEKDNSPEEDHQDQDPSTQRPPTMAEMVVENPIPMPPSTINLYKSCRYSAQLLVPAHAEPVKRAGELLRATFREIQRQAGTQVWLSAWNPDGDKVTIKRPKDIPTGTSQQERILFSSVFDNYIPLGPNKEGRLYLKLHLKTLSPDVLKIPLPEIGKKVQALEEMYGFRLNPNPNACQSARVSTLGWGFGTLKSMDTDKLTKEIRKTLQMPDHIALGLQWRTIANKAGVRYEWPKDKSEPRPPQALHFDIDDNYAGAWYPKFANLFKKGSRKKVLFTQIRLVPCFTTQIGKTLSDPMIEHTFQMAQKQAHFTNNFATRLTTNNIASLDSPIGENNVTLRRYLMMKAPEVQVTDRIFVTVDKSYRGVEHILVMVRRYSDQALRIINTMIPECLHLYGPEATQWFTPSALLAYQDIRWDPITNATTSTNDDALLQVVEEDFYGMGDAWKEPPPAPTPNFEDLAASLPQPTVRDILDARARGGIHDDTPSFGSAFGRSHSSSTIAPPGRTQTRRVEFNTVPTVHPTPNAAQDDASVSTMGTEATTGSTRRQLRQQVENNIAIRSQNLKMAATLERLQARLAAQGLSIDDDMSITSASTPEQPSATKGIPGAAADSAGDKT